jgi:hypothetical protein
MDGRDKRMINLGTLLNVANIIMLIGTLLLIRAVLKDRNILKGYDPIGSLLTLGGMIGFDTFYVVGNYWISLAISLVTTAYWALASAFTIRQKLFKKKSDGMKCRRCGKSMIAFPMGGFITFVYVCPDCDPEVYSHMVEKNEERRS